MGCAASLPPNFADDVYRRDEHRSPTCHERGGRVPVERLLYEMNTLHPNQAPFLGSSYWTAASPLPHRKGEDIFRREDSTCPSVLTKGDFGVVTPSKSGGRPCSVVDSCDSTADDSRSEYSGECFPNCEERQHFNSASVGKNGMNRRNHVDDSCELLDYSTSIFDDTFCEDSGRDATPQTPRRLFDEEEMVTPGSIKNSFLLSGDDEFVINDGGSSFSSGKNSAFSKTAKQDYNMRSIPSPRSLFLCRCPRRNVILPKLPRLSCNSANLNINSTCDTIVEFCKINTSSSPDPSKVSMPRSHTPSPTIATFSGLGFYNRERHFSTLPSQTPNQPIRLRITEIHPVDFFSYDPYFSFGRHIITTMSGKPYGNELSIRTSPQGMTLEDRRGETIAMIKSRYTHVPSMVVYAPKPRFSRQTPSGHRLSSDHNHPQGGGEYDYEGDYTSELYPWALIRKEGRTMTDACTVHLVDDVMMRCATPKRKGGGRTNSTLGLFMTAPAFRGVHRFEGDWHTSTVVTRTVPTRDGSKDTPCCVIVRDRTNVDAMDVTIAPGIDPLMMICYLAAHSKMDVEPIMGGS